MNATTAALRTREELARLAQGGDPDGADLAAFGKYADVIDEANTIYAEDGPAGVGAYTKTLQIAPIMAGDPNARPKPKIYTAADALAPQDPINWVVDNIFSAGSVALVVGDAGSGKTWACLDLAVTVATRQNWLGYLVGERGGPVLIVDEESGPRRLSLRLGDALRGHEAGPETPIFYTTLNRFDLRRPDDVVAICDAIRETGARLVVFDAFMELIPGQDENAVKDTMPALMALRGIGEQTGAALVVIHHANKNGGYRGSSAIKGAVDLMLAVENDGNGTLTVKSEKARDVDQVHFSALMNFGPDTFNLSPTVAPPPKVVYTKGETFVLQYLGQHGPSEVPNIESNADICSKATAHNAVYALTKKGLVQRVDPGGPGSKATYDLTKEGQAAYATL